MNKFQVISKLWPSGVVLPGGVDVNTVNPAAPPTPPGTKPTPDFIRDAPALAPGTGAPNGYRFLFWNTGRRVTNKLKVTWTFKNLSSWTTWTAIRWYGIIDSGGVQNPKLLTTTAFATEDDASMSGTPIDSANSTFTDDPGGQKAYPFGAPPNDRMASTQWGAASVAALNPFPQQTVLNEYLFAGWLQLILGGDAIGEFPEDDDPIVGRGGFYSSHLATSPISVDMDATVDLMAVYRVNPITLPPIPILERDPIRRITFIEWILDYDRLVNPFPLTRIAAVPKDLLKSLSPAELKQAISSANTITRRMEAVTKSLEAEMLNGFKPGEP